MLEIKNKIVQYLLIIRAFFLIIFFSVSAQAATHYVSVSGSDTWSNSTNISTPCSLATAATNADDDDIVYFRGGNYTSQQLTPSNSGSSGHVITFARYQSEIPSFTKSGSSHQPSVSLNGKSYILIDGLTFVGGGGGQIYIYNYSTYNEVKNCTFSGNYLWSAVDINEYSNYNYIHDNIFNEMGEATNEADETNTIRIGRSSYNRIIDNAFYEGGGHGLLWITYGASYNVIRGNAMNVSTYWGTSFASLDVFFGIENNSNYNLIEENTLTETGSPVGKHVQFQINGSSNNIFRKNIVDSTRGWNSLYNNIFPYNNEYNHIYNNTFYQINSVVNVGAWSTDTNATYYTRYNQWVNNIVHTSQYYGFRSGQGGDYARISNNVYRGSILYNNSGTDVQRFKVNMTLASVESSYPSEFSENLTSDPKFTDATNGDFTLQSDSPAIDHGVWLTTITSASGFKTSFTVNNPFFFYDGWGIPGETGDIIKTQNGAVTTIRSIDYETHTIIVSPAIDIVKGEGLALNYYGSYPDIGAYEYGNISPPGGVVFK